MPWPNSPSSTGEPRGTGLEDFSSPFHDLVKQVCTPRITTTKDIDTTTKEGKMLLMALAALTSSQRITMNGREFKGRGLTVEEVIVELNKTVDKVYAGCSDTVSHSAPDCNQNWENKHTTIQIPPEDITAKEV